MPPPADKPYHHGDLRRALVDTAAAMLREEDGWQFTLREVARRAGVSHGAPYKHFPDKGALLAELAAQGFDQLRETLVAATTPRPPSQGTAILDAARTYVRFGVDNPSLYRLMFGAVARDAGSVHLGERAMAAFGILVSLIEQGQDEGLFRRRAVAGQVAACWGLVHGLTMLAIDGLLLPEKVGTDPIEGALATMLEGLKA